MNWSIFKSRKFWALVLAILAAVASYATGQVDLWQALQAVIVALAAYTAGTAIEDAGAKAGCKVTTYSPDGGDNGTSGK